MRRREDISFIFSLHGGGGGGGSFPTRVPGKDTQEPQRASLSKESLFPGGRAVTLLFGQVTNPPAHESAGPRIPAAPTLIYA